MLEQRAAIDRVFHALADGTRRELIQQLSAGPAAVSELAKPFPISLAAVVQHLQVLEDCGLVVTRKDGRVRTCQLDPKGLRLAEQWIAGRRTLWEARLDRLDALLQRRVEASAGSGPPAGQATRPARRAKGKESTTPAPATRAARPSRKKTP